MIIHIFDMAGVASLTSRLLNDSGFQSVTLYRPKDDPYAISEYYSSRKIANNPIRMMIQLIVILLQLRPRIIVVHYHQPMVPVVKLICLLLRIPSKVLMQFHGSDFRLHGVKSYIPVLTDGTIGVTWDVVPDGGILLENVVDEELFYPAIKPENDYRALFIRSKPLDCFALALWYEKVFGLHLEVIDGISKQGIHLYKYMGNWLRTYGFYFDMKGLDALSKTACEALACGAIVVNEMGAFTYPFDLDNKFKIERLVEYYDRLATNF